MAAREECTAKTEDENRNILGDCTTAIFIKQEVDTDFLNCNNSSDWTDTSYECYIKSEPLDIKSELSEQELER